ncbi:ABC transporter permease, partial [Oscillospiraceae bacterium OttesenSCG-928-G22]|nr:ABC transporter permease [Oscillospiraceae bacterium OttesenSCG-928-G22]
MIENILLALGAIRANKMRSFLTMLGIIIGIGSVIGIVTVGNSLTNSFTDSMQQLGTNNISVSVMQRIDSDFNMTSAMSSMPAEADMYSDEQIADIELRFADDIDAIALSQSVGNGKATEGRDYANAAVIGVNAGYQKAANLTLTDGRFLSERDIDGRKRVCVVSDRFVKNLFPRLTGSGVGQEILINMGNGTIDSYYIIGVYEYQETGFSFGFSSEKDLRTDVYVPLSIAMKTAQYQNYMSFMIITKPGTDNGVFSSGLRRYLNNTYYAENDLWTAQVISMESAMSIMGDVMGTISTAVAV